MSARQPLIADSISRIYGATPVVDEVSLTLEPGRVTALLGQSGAGKSTLLRLFAGLETPDSGAIRLGDEVLSSQSKMQPAEKRHIGLIFQDFALFPHMTAQQNIMFGLSDVPKAEARIRAGEWLSRIGLPTRAGAYPHQLSGGEQQRIAIARALAPEPVAILMDEPFSGLDPALRADVRDAALATIRAAGVPALLVTHDASEAMISADHLAIMRGGRIVQQDKPGTVYSNPVDPQTARALGPVILLENLAADGLNPVATPFGEIIPPNPLVPGSISLGIRPERVLIDDASPVQAKLMRVRSAGAMQHVDIGVGEFTAQILVPAHTDLTGREQAGVRLTPESFTIFR